MINSHKQLAFFLVGILLLSEKVKSIGKLYTRYLIGLFCLPPIFAKANTAIHSSATFKSNFNCELVRFLFLQIDIKQARPRIYIFGNFHFHINVELVHSWFCKDLKANTESDLFLLSNIFISYLILIFIFNAYFCAH